MVLFIFLWTESGLEEFMSMKVLIQPGGVALRSRDRHVSNLFFRFYCFRRTFNVHLSGSQ